MDDHGDKHVLPSRQAQGAESKPSTLQCSTLALMLPSNYLHNQKTKVKQARTKSEIKKQKNSADPILDTNTSCLAGKKLDGTSEDKSLALNTNLNATLIKKINKTVKATGVWLW
jgi:hypothetical protein